MWSKSYQKKKEVQVDFYYTADTSEIEKINVLLHEKHHLINDDCNNSLSQIDTFKEHIENNSEKGRILDFMSLVNSEYPIDDSFNYQDYLKNTDIPSKYENYVKEIATQFYNENKKITISDDTVIFYFYSKYTTPQNSLLQYKNN